MKRGLLFLFLITLVISAGTFAGAQDVISARAGFLNYKQGVVALPKGIDGKELRQLEAGQRASTDQGRLELLLAPGSFLRLDNSSAIRLVSTKLTDVQVELLSGKTTLEVNEIPKHALLSVLWRNQSIPVGHSGVYRFEPDKESMRVYVQSGKLQLAGKTLKAGNYADLAADGTLTAAAKFNRKDLDEFALWNQARGFLLARSSLSAANSFLRRASALPNASLWYWDPFGYGYTYLPCRGSVMSPWGLYYHSPRTVYYGSSSGGYYSAGGSNSGYGGSASSGSSSSSASSSGSVSGAAPASHSAGGGASGPSSGGSGSSSGGGASHATIK